MRWQILFGTLVMSFALSACERIAGRESDDPPSSPTPSAPATWPRNANLTVPTEEMVWVGVSSGEDGRPTVVLGVPETDWTLLSITCTGANEIAFNWSMFDARPNSAYDAMVRVGGHVASGVGRATEMFEFDDSVLVSFLVADSNIQAAIANGQPFDVIAKEASAAEGWEGISAPGLQPDVRQFVTGCA